MIINVCQYGTLPINDLECDIQMYQDCNNFCNNHSLENIKFILYKQSGMNLCKKLIQIIVAVNIFSDDARITHWTI